MYNTLMVWLQAGQLRAAAVRFDEVLEAVPARSKLGGEAQLQKAICLDSAVSPMAAVIQVWSHLHQEDMLAFTCDKAGWLSSGLDLSMTAS